ncbi:MAG: hypothetical protein HFH80_04680 [Lachnospiraceae bacterium]|nr:hypothetical protein [Lachnospiraceae bacterium]
MQEYLLNGSLPGDWIAPTPAPVPKPSSTPEPQTTNVLLTEPTLPRGGTPRGNYERSRPGPDGRPIDRQNESADLLAEYGYDIEMLPERRGGNGYGIEAGSNPDYLIDGKAFDCYSPDGRNVRNIWSNVEDKTTRQAERIILNLDDYAGSEEDLYNQFMEYEIETLKELIIIKDGNIERWLPK